MSATPGKSPLDDAAAAQAFVAAWERTAAVLDGERRRDLRQLSELESARRFAELLSLPLPYPLRPQSGLVEQQRIFAKLRGR